MPVEQLSARPVQALASAATQDTSGLREGTQIEGRVLAVNPDSSLRLATRYGLIDADQSQIAGSGGGHGHGHTKLPPAAELIGTMVKLEVAGHSSAGRLIVTLISGGDTQAEQPPAPETGASSLEMAARIAADIAQLVSRQDGLAPVFAAARQIAALPQALPEDVDSMLQDLQDHAFNASAEMSALTFRQAVAASGLFLEARLARRLSGTVNGNNGFGVDPARALAAQDLKAALFGLKSVLETWVASFATAKPDEPLPPEPTGALEQTGNGLPPDQPAARSAALTRSIAASSTTFDTEALFAVLRPPPTVPTHTAQSQSQSNGSPVTPGSAGPPTIGKGRSDAAAIAALGTWMSVSGQSRDGNRGSIYGSRPALSTGFNPPVGPNGRKSSTRPPPPRRGSLPQGQAAVVLSGDPNADAQDLARKLAVKVGDALARITLGQYASLSETVTGQTADGITSVAGRLPPTQTKPPGAWLFEIPLRLGEDTSIAQFEIEHIVDIGSPQKTDGACWRVQFSLDIAPIGPVHARLILAEKRLNVGFWAEEAVGLRAIGTRLLALRGALEALNFVIDEIHVSAGRPPSGPPVRAGGFIDRNA